VASALAALWGCAGASPAPVPSAAATSEPLSVQALAGRCFRLQRPGGEPLQAEGRFWSGVVRLDSTRSLRLGPYQLETPNPHNGHVLVTLVPASEALTRDTMRHSSHWSIRPPDTLKLWRSTGYTGESITLRRQGDRWAGEREFFSDVVVAGEPRRFHPVQLVPADCAGAAGREGGGK
jgi:hypothetical protein